MLRQQPGLLPGAHCRSAIPGSTLSLPLPGHACYRHTHSRLLGPRIAAASKSFSSSNSSNDKGKGKDHGKPTPKGKGFGTPPSSTRRRRQDLQQTEQQLDRSSEGIVAAAGSSNPTANTPSDDPAHDRSSGSPSARSSPQPQPAAVPESPKAPANTPEPPEVPEAPETPPGSRPDTPESPDSPPQPEPEPHEPSAFLSGPGRDRSDEQAYDEEEAQPLPQGSTQGQAEPRADSAEGNAGGPGAAQKGRDQEQPSEAGDKASFRAVPTAAVLLDKPVRVQRQSGNRQQAASSSSSKGSMQAQQHERDSAKSAAETAAAATEQLLQEVKAKVGPFRETTGLDSSAFLKGLNEPAITSLKSLDAAERVRKGEAPGSTGSSSGPSAGSNADSTTGDMPAAAAGTGPAAAAAASGMEAGSSSSSSSGLPTASLSEDLHLMSQTAGDAASGPGPVRPPAAGGVRAFELATGRVEPKRLQKLEEAAGEVATAGADSTSSKVPEPTAAASSGPDAATASDAATAPPQQTGPTDASGNPVSDLPTASLSEDLHLMSKTGGDAASGPGPVRPPAAGGVRAFELATGNVEPKRLQKLEEAAGEVATAGTDTSSSTTTSSSSSKTGVLGQLQAAGAAAAADIGAGASTDLTQDIMMVSGTSGDAASGAQAAAAPAAGGLTEQELQQGPEGMPADRLADLSAAAGETADAGTAQDKIPLVTASAAAATAGEKVADVRKAAAAGAVSTGKQAAQQLGDLTQIAADKTQKTAEQLAAATASTAQKAAAGSKLAAEKVSSAAAAGGKQAVKVGEAAAAKASEGGKVAGEALQEAGAAAGRGTVRAVKVGSSWAARAGGAAAQGADVVAAVLRRMWAVLFRVSKLATLLLLEGGRRLLAVVAGLLSALTHRVLLLTAHPAEVEHAVTNLATPPATPHRTPADSFSTTAASKSISPSEASGSAGAGGSSMAGPSAPAEPASAAAAAPAVLSSMADEHAPAAPGRVVTVGLTGSTLHASSYQAVPIRPSGRSSSAGKSSTSPAMESTDIRDISKLWGISDVVSPAAGGNVPSSSPHSTSSTKAKTTSSSSSSKLPDHKHVDLSDSMAHVVPSVPSPEAAAERPTGGLDTLAATAANSLSMKQVNIISTAAGSLKAVQNTLADTPAGAAAADAAGSVKHAAGAAASAAASAARPGDWLSAGRAILRDVRAVVGSAASQVDWEAPELEDSTQNSLASSNDSTTSTTSTQSGNIGSPAVSGTQTSPASASATGPTQAPSTAASASPAAAAAAAPAAAEGVLRQPEASEPGVLLCHVHELLHELLRLEDQLQHQLKRVHEVQHRLDQALLLQQQRQQQQTQDADTTTGTAAATAAAAAAQGGDADAADDLDSSGICNVLLGELEAELKQADRQLHHLEATAASILTQLVAAGVTAAALRSSGTAALPTPPLSAADTAGQTSSAAAPSGGSNGSSGSSTPGRRRRATNGSRLHGNQPALGVTTSSSGGGGRPSWQWPDRKRSQQELAQQLLAAGSVGLLADQDLNELLKRAAKGELDLSAGSRGSGSTPGLRYGGSSGAGGGGGGGGRGRGRGRGSGWDGGRHEGGGGGGLGGFFHWLTHLRAKHAARLLFQGWLASIVVLGSFWYAYQVLYKMPMEEFKSMTHTAKHVAEAGAGVAHKTANVASHVAQAVGVAGSSTAQDSGGGWGIGAAAKSGIGKLRGMVRGLGGGASSIVEQPIKVAGATVKAGYRGGKGLLKLLVPGAGGGQQQTAGSTSAGGSEPSAAAVAAARVGVGALLLLLANRTVGGGGSSSSDGRKKDPRPSQPSDPGYDWGFAVSSGGSRAAAAKASASNMAGRVASQSATLASALSAMPSWFMSNIKTVAGSSSSGRHTNGGTTAGSSSKDVGDGGRGLGSSSKAVKQRKDTAAAPAGVMSYEDGVVYSLDDAASPGWGGSKAAGAAGPVSGAAVWGPTESALLAGNAGGSIRPDQGQQQHGLVVDDGDQHQLQVLYRSLSTGLGSWR